MDIFCALSVFDKEDTMHACFSITCTNKTCVSFLPHHFLHVASRWFPGTSESSIKKGHIFYSLKQEVAVVFTSVPLPSCSDSRGAGGACAGMVGVPEGNMVRPPNRNRKSTVGPFYNSPGDVTPHLLAGDAGAVRNEKRWCLVSVCVGSLETLRRYDTAA